MENNNKSVQKLSSEWSQIQLADSIKGVASDKFAKDSNAILFPLNLEGDFEGLTDYFIEFYNLEENESKHLRLFHLSQATQDESLHPLIRIAAGNFHDAIVAITDGKRADFTSRELIKSYLKHPLMTFKIISAIHFEAFKLWTKGLKFIKKKLKIKNNITFEN